MNNLATIEVSPPAPVPDQQSGMMELISNAVMGGADIAVIERLMDLKERMDGKDAERAFVRAISDAKAEMPTIRKNRRVHFTSNRGTTDYNYEDLAGVMDAIGPILSKHGLSVRYNTSSEIGQPVSVTCILSHRDGHSERNTLVAARDDSGNKNGLQQVGSTITYLQRYTLKAALGLAASKDDDGAMHDVKSEDIPDVIDSEQRDRLLSLINEVGADVEKLCGYYRIEAVADLPKRDFNHAIAQLEKRRA